MWCCPNVIVVLSFQSLHIHMLSTFELSVVPPIYVELGSYLSMSIYLPRLKLITASHKICFMKIDMPLLNCKLRTHPKTPCGHIFFNQLLMNHFFRTLEQHDNVVEVNIELNWSNWLCCSRVGFLSVLLHHMPA